ncbi:methyltransferase domain-containing protein [candidate division KSB1 bacterium]|nr:methyltransferase domain-containing protein [candidate division KSB1 bacterium]
MSDKTQKLVSDSLETDEQMLPEMPFLLEDLWALGSSVKDILRVVENLGLSSDSTVLDLGCGKGAVSVPITSRFKSRITGVDAMSSFLKDANRKAAEYGVAERCRFICQDIMDYVKADHDFDLVIFASVGGIWGSLQNTVAQLRRQIRNGGYMVIDDGYARTSGPLQRKHYEQYRDHQTTLGELTALGDTILTEIDTTQYSRKINRAYLDSISKRGAELILQKPELKDKINSYILLQQQECEFLDHHIVGALWLLQKNENLRT